MKRMPRILLIVVVALIVVLLCIWLGSVIRCEYLTIRYGEQFRYSYKEHTMLAPPDYLKLLEYSEERAVIYYVERGVGGDILVFERENGQEQWQFVSWNTIWSRSGSADSFVWPYIR